MRGQGFAVVRRPEHALVKSGFSRSCNLLKVKTKAISSQVHPGLPRGTKLTMGAMQVNRSAVHRGASYRGRARKSLYDACRADSAVVVRGVVMRRASSRSDLS